MYCVHYRPQRSCGKVIFSQVSVSHSVHRGMCIPACTEADTSPPGQTSPWADTLLPSACWDTHTLPPLPSECWDTPPPRQPLLRMVRILLECILVNMIYFVSGNAVKENDKPENPKYHVSEAECSGQYWVTASEGLMKMTIRRSLIEVSLPIPDRRHADKWRSTTRKSARHILITARKEKSHQCEESEEN